MTKSFHDTRIVANNVYKEFFAQGDEEKKLGLGYSSEIMDRSKMGEIPRMQVDFLKVIVLPAFAILYDFLGEPISPWIDSLNDNLNNWKSLETSGIPYSMC
jgi:cAMP and cAMP-inhibited cGMP 3',5'-cyclic phosphodiesterase 10